MRRDLQAMEAGYGGRNSKLRGVPRRLSSRLLGGVDGLWMMLFVKGDEREVPNGTED